jgi:2-keto-4-pentenoate hydratase/2-oxohepta-3-ene-1,7-dioic acid hydratase in catechol pathway
VIGPDQTIIIPTRETKADYEVELAVVIAIPARRLTRETAMDYVFGYTVLNDISAREIMVREKFQIMLSKSPDTFCPIGPVVGYRRRDQRPSRAPDLDLSQWRAATGFQHGGNGRQDPRTAGCDHTEHHSGARGHSEHGFARGHRVLSRPAGVPSARRHDSRRD